MAPDGPDISLHSIAVIVPCLNEADVIRRTLESVGMQDHPHEIIVSDGGSSDATRSIAAEYGRVVRAHRGRASQMNAGAAEARSDILFFLHADTVLPERALESVQWALKDRAIEAGTFRLRFDRPTPLLRLYSFFTRFPFPRLCFGDRGLFVRRATFEEVGGFPSVPLFEDVEIVRVLAERGGFAFLDDFVTTSSRRFYTSGPLRQQIRNTYLWLSYVMGRDLERLVDYYPYRGGS